MSLLLRPFGVCASFLSQSTMDTMLRPGMEKAVKTIQALEEKDFKDKVIWNSHKWAYFHTSLLTNVNFILTLANYIRYLVGSNVSFFFCLTIPITGN